MSPRRTIRLAGVGREPYRRRGRVPLRPTPEQPQEERMTEPPTITRLSINLAPTVAAALRATAAREALSITEATRHAIALWKLVTDEQAAGHRVVIQTGRRSYREIVLS